MVPSVVRLPMRRFAARYFAVVALGTAALLTPAVEPFLASYRLALALPFFAAACAYGWAWLLHPRVDVQVYGKRRGALVALLAYLSFTAILAAYLQWVMPARPATPHYREALLLIAAFVWTPYPWAVLIAGAIAGDANLRNLRARVHAWTAASRRVGTGWVAVLRTTHTQLNERAADPRARAAVTTIVSSCLYFAGGAMGLVWLHPAIALSDAQGDMSLRLLPGAVALMLAVAGWALGRVLLAIVPAAQRLRVMLMSSLLAGAAAVWFSVEVAARGG